MIDLISFCWIFSRFGVEIFEAFVFVAMVDELEALKGSFKELQTLVPHIIVVHEQMHLAISTFQNVGQGASFHIARIEHNNREVELFELAFGEIG